MSKKTTKKRTARSAGAIAINSLGFLRSAELLTDKVNSSPSNAEESQNQSDYITGGTVLLSLGIEVAFKAIQADESEDGTFNEGHNLRTLYDATSKSARDEICDSFEKYHWLTGCTLVELLDSNCRVFEDFRYYSEYRANRISCNVIAMRVLAAILEKRLSKICGWPCRLSGILTFRDPKELDDLLTDL